MLVGRTTRCRLAAAAIVLTVTIAQSGCGAPEPLAGASFSGEQAFAELATLTEMGPRYTGSPGMSRQRKHIRAVLEAAGAEVITQSFERRARHSGEMLELVNFVGRFRGDLSERVAIVTHHDTRHEAENDPDPAMRKYGIIGANDGGSSTAVLLTLARILGEHSPEIGVDLVFFDGEEWGDAVLGEWCQGSRYMAEHIDEIWPVHPRWLICIDMVGDADLGIRREPSSAQAAPELTAWVWRVAGEIGVDALVSGRWPPLVDDHLAFMQMGIPAILLIDFDYTDDQGQSYWHTHQDVIEHCSAESLEQVGTLLLELVRREGVRIR